MFDKIQKRLLGNGYIPDLIIDIGAHRGDWTKQMMAIYPCSKYMLFEAVEYPELEKYKTMSNCEVNNALLNNEQKMVEWYEEKGTGDSMFRELTMFYKNTQPKKRESIPLNSFFKNGCEYDNILMKIDCQGAEIPILKGATELYNKVDFIIMEVPYFGRFNENVATFAEHIAFMDNIGFEVFEHLESHVVNNFTIQVDIIFIRKGHSFIRELQESFMTRFHEDS